MPDDQDWWPYLSILCVQKNVFGKDEIIGNLVVTNLQKYIESPIFSDLPTNNTDDVVKKLIGQVSYDFNRVRRSLFDAYYGRVLFLFLKMCQICFYYHSCSCGRKR